MSEETTNALTVIGEVFDFDAAEYAAQFKAAAEGNGKKAFAKPGVGKIQLIFSKRDGKIEFTNPADLDKPEEDRTKLSPSKITGIIAMSQFGLTCWPKDDPDNKASGPRAPICKMTGYTTKAIDPETRTPIVKPGMPAMPFRNKFAFVDAYTPTAQRRAETVNPDGTKATSNVPYSCANCKSEWEKTKDKNHIFMQCGYEGNVDIALFGYGSTNLKEPVMTWVRLPRTSVEGFAEFIHLAMTKYRAQTPMDLVVEITVEKVPTDRGSYEKLVFRPIGEATPEQKGLLGKLYQQVKQAQLAAESESAEALPEGQPAAASGGVKGAPAPF